MTITIPAPVNVLWLEEAPYGWTTVRIKFTPAGEIAPFFGDDRNWGMKHSIRGTEVYIRKKEDAIIFRLKSGL
jgi:hypothetical protein